MVCLNSRSSVMSLRNELNAMKKGTKSIDVYFQKIKQICDKLAALSVILDDEDLLHVALDQNMTHSVQLLGLTVMFL